MVDGIECYSVNVDIEKLFQNQYLQFKGSHNTITGEIYDSSWVKFLGLSFRIKNKNCQLKGSIHKYFNKGGDNDNDFTFQDICNSIDDLNIRFSIDINKTKPNNIEFGVNIEYKTTLFLKSLVRYYQGKLIIEFDDNIPGIKLKMAKHTLKIYRKDDNTMRVEIHVDKMQYLTDKGVKISTLADLKKPEIYPQLKRILLDSIKSLMIFDTSKAFSINPQTIENYCSRDYWLRLKDNRTKKDYHLKQFREISEFTGANWQQKELLKLVSDKWDYLFANSAKVPIETNIDNSVKVPVKNNLLRKSTFKIKGTIADTILEPTNNENILPQHQNKICPITGLIIPKENSNKEMLTAKGIKYYYEIEPEIYRKVLLLHLDKTWHNAPLKTQIGYISKSIRNEYFKLKNVPRNNTKNSINKIFIDTVLYDTKHLITDNKKRIAGSI